ncbi:MAG: DUF2784 domain-containing protein [Betaproteobacteria bacterium]
MLARVAADATVALHLAFILFVVFGGALVWRRAPWAWLHAPAVAWVVWLEFTQAMCPLTPLENALRERAGEAGYTGGFIEHYLIPIIYPGGLTPAMQMALGAVVVTINGTIYTLLWRRWRRARRNSWQGAKT